MVICGQDGVGNLEQYKRAEAARKWLNQKPWKVFE